MRKAFTILESLAAAALTALLMVAVMHILGTLGRGRAVLARQADDGAWRSDLLDTLRRDLVNATQVNFRQDGMILTGHGALEPVTLACIDEPVTVVYGLAEIKGRRWLVRRQSPRDGLTNQTWSELLCPDVTAFTVRPVRGLAADSEAPPPKDRALEETIPAMVTVGLDGPGGRVMNETLVLR